MNLMFWKKKLTTENNAESVQEKPVDKSLSGKSLGRESRDRETSEGSQGETTGASPAHPKQRPTIVAVIGVLVLATIGLAAWKILFPSPEQDDSTVSTPATIQTIAPPGKNLIRLPQIEFLPARRAPSRNHTPDIEALKEKNAVLQSQIDELKIKPLQVDDPQSIKHQAEIETLKKNNDELHTQIAMLKAELPKIEKDLAERHQADIDALANKNSELLAQIEALRKKQQHPTSPASRPTGKAQPPARSGDLAIGSKNPKSTAMTLREAIEAMNASSGEAGKTNTK